MPNHGPKNDDIFIRSLKIGNKTVLDAACNLKVNTIRSTGNQTVRGNSCVTGTVLTDNIEEKTFNQGVTITGNVFGTKYITATQKFLGDIKGKVCDFNNNQVVGNQQNPIGNIGLDSSSSNISPTVNMIMQVLRNHGLMATTPP